LQGWGSIGQGHFGQANREFSIAAAKHFEGDREANGERVFSSHNLRHGKADGEMNLRL
jgi:hypothetical protein